mgnify:CR=1 FL=1
MSTFNDFINLNELDQKVLCKDIIENLSPRLQLIAVRRFYQNQSLNSIAEELGVTYARAYQLERKLLHIIRRYVKAEWL